MSPPQLSTRVDNWMPTIQVHSIVQQLFYNAKVLGKLFEESIAEPRRPSLGFQVGVDQSSDLVICGQPLSFNGLLCTEFALGERGLDLLAQPEVGIDLRG